MSSSDFKIMATFESIIAFLIVSLPFTYKVTNGLFGGIVGKLADSSGCPTTLGLIIHSIVFGIIIYGLMTINL
jgi:hypothetical protein